MSYQNYQIIIILYFDEKNNYFKRGQRGKNNMEYFDRSKCLLGKLNYYNTRPYSRLNEEVHILRRPNTSKNIRGLM